MTQDDFDDLFEATTRAMLDAEHEPAGKDEGPWADDEYVYCETCCIHVESCPCPRVEASE